MTTQTSTTTTENVEQALVQLEEKVKQELNDEHVYEALQYVQSFIARKKKILGQKGTSTAVFSGVNLMTSNYKANQAKTASNSAGLSAIPLSSLGTTAGALLKWFIEDGAGLDYNFHLHPEGINTASYCDIDNLYSFLGSIEITIAGHIVDAIYNPLHVVIAKTRVKKNSPLSKRINKLEILFASIFFANKRWLNAFKSYNRLQDAEKMTAVLEQWSNEGYQCEKPLFFARGILQLLSENKVSLAKDLLHNSVAHVEENIGLGQKAGGPQSASLAIWHAATILTDLANFPVMPRVDKTKLFGLLFRRYGQVFGQVDTKLFDLLQKIGEVVFHYVLENPSAAANPMAMLQSLLAGGQPNKSNGNSRGNQNRPALDFDNLIQLMGKMGQL